MKTEVRILLICCTSLFLVGLDITVVNVALPTIGRELDADVSALQWTIDNPYAAIFMPQVPALPGDRKENLDRAIALLKANVAKEREYLSKPANVAKMHAQRRDNGTEQKYCWRS